MNSKMLTDKMRWMFPADRLMAEFDNTLQGGIWSSTWKAGQRTQQFMDTDREEQLPSVEKQYLINKPNWVRLIIQKNIPEKLAALDELSKNMWWCWNPDAIDLFESIDVELWQECEKNPIMFLDKIPYNRFVELEKDEDFLKKLNRCTSILTST